MYDYIIRPLNTRAIRERQTRAMVEITTRNPAIPLPYNFLERWCTVPADVQLQYKQIYDFKVRADDVFLVTFMKSGTTWTQEALWLLMHDLDYSGAKKANIAERSKFLELSTLYNAVCSESVEKCDIAPSPRLIKTHLPANLLPQQIWQKKQKIVFVARNVKDVVVSSYHFVKGMKTWSGNMDQYVEDFMNNEIMYTPFWPRIIDFWKMRHEPHIFFLTYEDMKRDLGAVLQDLCEFLDKPALSDMELKELLEHLSFEKMRDNNCANLGFTIKTAMGHDFQFIRRGIVGSYKDELTPEHQRKLDEWSKFFLAPHGLCQADIFGQF